MWTLLLVWACSGSLEAPAPVDVMEPPIIEPTAVVADTGDVPEDSGAEESPGAVRVGRRWYPTLQDAVAQAPAGSTLWVEPGVHFGPFERENDWHITIRGSTGRREDVVLQGPEGQGVFEFGWGIPMATVLRDLTVRTSRAGVPNHAMGVVYDGDLRLKAVLVDGGSTNHVLLVRGCTLLIEDTDFKGGAIALSLTDQYPLTAEIRRTVFDGSMRGEEVGNRFVEVISRSWLLNLQVTFEDCEFRDAHMGGGAVVVLRGPHPVATFRRSRFANNTFGWGLGGSTMQGAALKVAPDSYLTPPSQADVLVEDCVFEDNVGEAGPSALRVDYAWDMREPTWMPLATVTIRGTSFRRNVTGERTLRGGAIDAQQGARLLLEDVDFGTGIDANLPSDIGCWTWEGRELGEDFSAEIECR